MGGQAWQGDGRAGGPTKRSSAPPGGASARPGPPWTPEPSWSPSPHLQQAEQLGGAERFQWFPLRFSSSMEGMTAGTLTPTVSHSLIRLLLLYRLFDAVKSDGTDGTLEVPSKLDFLLELFPLPVKTEPSQLLADL